MGSVARKMASVLSTGQLRPISSKFARAGSGRHCYDKSSRIAALARIGKETYANLERIVECVNGCQGIVAPETTIPKLVGALRAMTRLASNSMLTASVKNLMALAVLAELDSA